MEVRVPDIGDFTDVPVIEILVATGDEVDVETPLVVLESDKATMEVPSPAAGKIGAITVAVGDRVSEGSVLLALEAAEAAAEAPAPAVEEPAAAAPDTPPAVPETPPA